ncbi:hypothetical protein Pyn_40478 [Prunus yedoensis var. nudiflora]|uniref:WAT1-related protein n=1 Tax=Prunus yedoensis var. nudiflora TaxID=2094558 RepID=A0A314XUG3_PRUYE|nr:hypothetical protein Pyn_40478 [Prunus yedoensis var. nudiflora]
MEGCSYYLAMVLVQLIYGGSNILIKFSLAEGLNPIVFVVYRHVMAMVLVGPFAYVLERLEKLKIRTARGQAKVAGTLFCIGGSLVFTFWKGGYLFKGFVKRPLINISVGEMRHVKENWIKGALLILTSHIAWSAWLILQAVVSKVYTARLSLTTMICFFASLQSSFLALFFARNPISWRLEWNLQLLTIVYCGVVISALAYYLQTWCISYKGPVFAAMFSPLQVIIVALFSAIAFAERLHFGSLIGAFLIIAGLYCVLWGKRKDNLVAEQTENGKGVLEDIKVLENDISVTNPVTRVRT